VGLITILAGVAAVALHVLVKFRTQEHIPDDDPERSSKQTKITTIRRIVNQVFLVLTLVSSFQGFASLSSITLCLTQSVVSFELAVVIGFVISGIFILGAAVSGLDMFLAFRERRRRERKVTKEKISAPIGNS
jgi:hypothetical protein